MPATDWKRSSTIVNERMVQGERGRPAGQHQEERPVRGRRVGPQRIDARDVRPRAQRDRPVVVRVDVAAHHFALGGVGEHVLAEQRRHHQEGQDPQRQHVGQRPDRHPAAGPERLEEAVPDADEEDHPAVHGDDPGQHQRGRRPVGLAEEPRAGYLLLEGGARQRRPDADEDDGQEPQERRPAQEGPVLGIACLRFHAFGQRDAAGDPEVHRLGTRRTGDGGARPPDREPVLSSTSRSGPRGSQSRLSCPGATEPGGGRNGLTPGEHVPAIDPKQHCNAGSRVAEGQPRARHRRRIPCVGREGFEPP